MSEPQTDDDVIDMYKLKLDLVKQKGDLRKELVTELRKLNSWSVGLREAFFRSKISQHEKTLVSLEENFLDYDKNFGNYLGLATTATGKGITLNTRINLGISCSQLSDDRNAVLSLLNNIQQNLNAKTSRANNLIVLSLSTIAIVISTLAFIFANFAPM